MTSTIKPKRGTRAQISAAATSGTLVSNEVMHITDTGQQAMAETASEYSVAQPAGQLRRSLKHIAGALTGNSLTTLSMTASRIYYVPFSVSRKMTLTGLRICLTTGAAGTASVGIYANTESASTDAPGSKIASGAIADTTGTGNKDASLSCTLYPGRIYWAAVIASAAITIRCIQGVYGGCLLGFQDNNTAAINALYEAGSGSTLPTTASGSLTELAANTPAIYLLE